MPLLCFWRLHLHRLGLLYPLLLKAASLTLLTSLAVLHETEKKVLLLLFLFLFQEVAEAQDLS